MTVTIYFPASWSLQAAVDWLWEHDIDWHYTLRGDSFRLFATP